MRHPWLLLNDFKIRWQVRSGEGTNLRETTTVERGRERPVTGGLRKALALPYPARCRANGGKTPATLQLPAMVTVRVPAMATGGNGGFFGRPANPGATGDVCRKADVDANVDTAGAEVAAEVGDKDGELENERAAGRAYVIPDARVDVIHDARADVTAYTAADVINPRADISSYMEGKNSNLG
ncbi:UNVERIFIED_CONTAM: hypothetical protein Sindi_3017400, partial [Sesamum indicum]